MLLSRVTAGIRQSTNYSVNAWELKAVQGKARESRGEPPLSSSRSRFVTFIAPRLALVTITASASVATAALFNIQIVTASRLVLSIFSRHPQNTHLIHDMYLFEPNQPVPGTCSLLLLSWFSAATL